jgi:hypothetical protein
MEIFQFNNFSSFLFFIIPGFISLKVYDLFVPNERRDFSKSIVEVIAYSSFNLIILLTVMNELNTYKFDINNPILSHFFLLIGFIIMPILWAYTYLKIINWKIISSHIVHPTLRPWDLKFSEGEPAWIIVHLKDGRLIGGRYQEKSYASSYPAEEQIYLEQVWRLDENGKFLEAIGRSKGIIIFNSEITAVEFFESID